MHLRFARKGMQLSVAFSACLLRQDIVNLKVKHTRYSEVHEADRALLNTPPPRAETPRTRGSQPEKNMADFWFVRISKITLLHSIFYSSPLCRL